MKALKAGLLTAFIFLIASCKKDAKPEISDKQYDIDSTQIAAFFSKHPDFKDYANDVKALYRKNDWRFVWYDEDGRNDFAEILYSRARNIEMEGVIAELPNAKEFEELFDDDRKNPDLNKELLISSMYFFYAKKVFEGVDPYTSRELGWYLPREKKSYVEYLNELMDDPDLLKKDKSELTGPYFNLRAALQKYRVIRDNGGWGQIELPDGAKKLRKGDSGPAVAQLRTRLFLSGDLASDSKSTSFDRDLENAVKKYQNRQLRDATGIVDKAMVTELNIPVEARIKTILVNMERCRWIPADVFGAKEHIAVNIPSYTLDYFKDGKTKLHSNVVVGKELHKTVIFSGKMSYLVFSPYWNVPNSILENEIKPAIERDPGYLEKHNMEWHEERVRQRPGGSNSLGLVKFMFPNSNNIYLHDTPAKSLFNKEDRAFSHGCIRVEKARQLAIEITDWNSGKVDDAMNAGTEQSIPLDRKIPVYIAYFTATADNTGNVAFFDDVYKRDGKLANVLYREEVAK